VGRACGTHERGEKSVQFLVVKPEGRIPLGRQRRGCEDGIKMHLRETGWESVCNGCSWLRIGTGGGLLWTRSWPVKTT
jgi:hypothetical protein